MADVLECLRTYDVLGLWREAEDVIRKNVVDSFVKKVPGEILSYPLTDTLTTVIRTSSPLLLLSPIPLSSHKRRFPWVPDPHSLRIPPPYRLEPLTHHSPHLHQSKIFSHSRCSRCSSWTKIWALSRYCITKSSSLSKET